MDIKDKIPFYNIMNMFFVGAVFSLCLVFFLHSYIPFEWIKENAELLSDWSILISAILFIVMYELGFIINRMGSIIIAPIYEGKKGGKFNIWPKEEYGIDVSELAKANPRFQSMITELNLMRSHIMMYLILLILSLLMGEWLWSVIFVLLIVIFTFGGKKHNTKINIIRKQAFERKEKENQEVQKTKEYLDIS